MQCEDCECPMILSKIGELVRWKCAFCNNEYDYKPQDIADPLEVPDDFDEDDFESEDDDEAW